jgi:hypothetical protein
MFSVSCSDTYPTYEELKSDEKKQINKIIAEKGIQVLNEYPADGVFGENEFVELSSGIYLNVVDSGNGNRAGINATTVLIRVKAEYTYADSIYKFSSFSNMETPFEFKYGHAYNVVSAHSSYIGYGDPYVYFFSAGLESVLSYVGDGAEVKLLVPGYSEVNLVYSGESKVEGGSYFQTYNRAQYIPVYYERVKYTFY